MAAPVFETYSHEDVTERLAKLEWGIAAAVSVLQGNMSAPHPHRHGNREGIGGCKPHPRAASRTSMTAREGRHGIDLTQPPVPRVLGSVQPSPSRGCSPPLPPAPPPASSAATHTGALYATIGEDFRPYRRDGTGRTRRGQPVPSRGYPESGRWGVHLGTRSAGAPGPCREPPDLDERLRKLEIMMDSLPTILRSSATPTRPLQGQQHERSGSPALSTWTGPGPPLGSRAGARDGEARRPMWDRRHALLASLDAQYDAHRTSGDQGRGDTASSLSSAPSDSLRHLSDASPDATRRPPSPKGGQRAAHGIARLTDEGGSRAGGWRGCCCGCFRRRGRGGERVASTGGPLSGGRADRLKLRLSIL